MKTSICKILLCLLLFTVFQSQLKAERVKKLHKSWPVNKVLSLSVENKFGNISFLNTRNDSVTIDIVVETDNKDNRNWTSISDLIDFSISFENGTINAQTIFNEKFKTNQEFTIAYTINIPADKPLDVTNKFGDVTLSDLKAKGKFEISYGNIFGNSILAPSDQMIEMDLKYSNASFETINRLKAQIAYSKFRANKIETTNSELFVTSYLVFK